MVAIEVVVFLVVLTLVFVLFVNVVVAAKFVRVDTEVLVLFVNVVVAPKFVIVAIEVLVAFENVVVAPKFVTVAIEVVVPLLVVTDVFVLFVKPVFLDVAITVSKNVV